MCRRRRELQVPEIQELPQSTGTPGRLRPEKPPPPSRDAEDRPGGPQPAAGRVPRDIGGKPTGPPAASHPLAGRARDPGVTTPAGDPTEPRDPDSHQAATGIGQADAKNHKLPDPGATTQADQATTLHTRCDRGRVDKDLYHQKKSQERGGVKGPT
ncbi:proline-rich proteoglycan 2-like [Nothobranchius furzeri]|uniref:proline-rich proteoglycan 2-like n=1 Tax=Nothobranchius furzeri TaxID=105023 RepID=UPI0039048699